MRDRWRAVDELLDEVEENLELPALLTRDKVRSSGVAETTRVKTAAAHRERRKKALDTPR